MAPPGVPVSRPAAHCRLCLGEHLEPLLTLASTPVGDRFWPSTEAARREPSFDTRLMGCRGCGQVQLSNVVNQDAVYRDYLYTTAVSLGLPEHFRTAAARLAERHRLAPGALVVEIGSNEGVMLRAFREMGCRVIGIDPAEAIARAATQAGIPTRAAYFDDGLARELRATHGPAALVLANNVIANIPDLEPVARGILALLADDGHFVFETSYLRDVVEGTLIDTIYHEHLSYLAVAPLTRFFARHGLSLVDAERIAPKGGSLRGTVAAAGAPVAPAVAAFSAAEAAAGLTDPARYRAFESTLAALRAGAQARAKQANEAGIPVLAYGAAVGNVAMVENLGLAPWLAGYVDDNPTKIGTFAPGSALPVFDAAILTDGRPRCVFVLAWRYIDTIRERQAAFLAKGGTLLNVALNRAAIEEIRA